MSDSVDGLKLHDEAVRDQDDHLDNLLAVIGRNKQLAGGIHQELREQETLLEDVDNGVNKATQHVRNQRMRVQRLLDATMGNRFWVCVVILMVLIVILLAIPKSNK